MLKVNADGAHSIKAHFGGDCFTMIQFIFCLRKKNKV